MTTEFIKFCAAGLLLGGQLGHLWWTLRQQSPATDTAAAAAAAGMESGSSGRDSGDGGSYADQRRQLLSVTWRESVQFAIPALLFVIVNASWYFLLLIVNPAFATPLVNLKILTTGVTFHVLAMMPCSRRWFHTLQLTQWLALLFLLAGTLACTHCP